jgi:hypothetical protein
VILENRQWAKNRKRILNEGEDHKLKSIQSK